MRYYIMVLLMTMMGMASALENKVDEGEAIFARSVYPMLQAKCMACHGEDPKKIKGELWLNTREAMIKGGENGSALIPGDPDKSLLFVAVTWKDPDLEMPPKENDRLSPEQIAALKRWISLGAPWLEEERRVELAASAPKTLGRVILTSVGGQSSDWAGRGYKEDDLWSFKPIQPVEVPASLAGSPLHPIDYLINRTLAEKGISPVGKADRLTLIRRVSLDLTGLLPTPEEIDAFTMDAREDAWERLVDRLLASPRYGEKWASHWLDVVRYADSSGFANDYPRPHAWRYRDYVVRAFNADKPYDQFVREQLAGDEIDENNPELLMATGFLRTGPWEHTSMSVASVTRQLFLDDVTNSVGLTFLGHELRCAQCHDHKFDPIPTRDYYRIQSVFAPVQFADRDAAFLEQENREGFVAGQARLKELLTHSGKVRSFSTLPQAEWPTQEWDKDAEKVGQGRVNKKREEYMKFDLQAYEPRVFSVYNGPTRVLNSYDAHLSMPQKRDGNIDQVHILKGGSLEAATDAVVSGTLAVIEAMRGQINAVEVSELTTARDGRRLALANWIVSPKNPLAARVMVNRIWLSHFGHGIAKNPNNFGAMGAKPTHPALLDYLAQRFMDEKWSIKAMHRFIMTSEAYKRSSAALPQADAEKDPENNYYARFETRRMTAEELRDNMLYASQELNLMMGGIPARPEINYEVAMQPRQIMGGIAMAYQPDAKPEQRHRRTIYTQRIRTMRDPLLEVFNQPSLDLSSERRDASTITPQAFSLLNSQFSMDRSIAMALRLQKQHGNVRAQIADAFRLTVGRQPTLPERDSVMQHLLKQTEHHAQNKLTPQVMPTYTIRQMVDEKTGVLFFWVEDLDVYRDSYVADRKAWDVSAETRALADVCLVLFNSNEYVYVY